VICCMSFLMGRVGEQRTLYRSVRYSTRNDEDVVRLCVARRSIATCNVSTALRPLDQGDNATRSVS
jgi:hypothetical protein